MTVYDVAVHPDMVGWHPKIATNLAELQPGTKFAAYRPYGMGAGETLCGVLIEIVEPTDWEQGESQQYYSVLCFEESASSYSDGVHHDPPQQTGLLVHIPEKVKPGMENHPLYARAFLLRHDEGDEFVPVINALA